MNDLSKYVELYRMTTEHDTEVLWSKVAIIREAIADGADVETLLSECGKESGDSRKQVRKFYAVARVFDEISIMKNYDYWIYQVAATAPGVDPDVEDTHMIAWGWLETAAMGRKLKRGKKTIHAKHTARTLRKLIREAASTGSAKPKPETVYKGTARIVYLDHFDSDPYSKLMLATNDDIQELRMGETVTVTITRSQPQPETVNAGDESEADAA